MGEALRGILAWSVAGFVWWAIGPELANGELSEVDGFLRWLLEYGWIAWMSVGAAIVVLYGLVELLRSE